jgi:hypothetical protein
MNHHKRVREKNQGQKGVEAKVVTFPNGNRARLVYAREGVQASEISAALDLSLGLPLVIVIGGADSLDRALERRLAHLLREGVTRAAASANAMMIDGGTQAGVMTLMGAAAALEGECGRLIGVAPAGKVTYPGGPPVGGDEAPLDSNHGRFVLAPADEWGGETVTMFQLADAISKGHRVAVVLIGGGRVAEEELRAALERGYPVIALAGTGGFSDRLLRSLASAKHGTADLSDEIGAVIATADIRPFPPDGSSEDLNRVLARELT